MEVFPKRKELAIAQTAFRSSRKNLHFSSRFSTKCRSSEGGLKRASLFEVGVFLKVIVSKIHCFVLNDNGY